MGRLVQAADRHQASFLPASLEDYVDADNPVRIVDAFIDELELPYGSTDIGTRLIDHGAQGIMIPHVESAAQAREMVEVYRTPPRGTRSDAGGVLTRWAPLSRDEKLTFRNDNLLLSVAIESVTALENVEDIAAVDGIDVISIGSADQSVDLGIPKSFENEKLLAAFKRVGDAARANGKALRLSGWYSHEFFRVAINYGANVIIVSGDDTLEEDMRDRMRAFNGL